MDKSGLLVEVEDGVGRIRFNRPQRRNAFDNETMKASLQAVEDLNADDSVRVIVVSGEGPSFSSGFDLKSAAERALETPEDWRAQLELQFDFIMAFWNSAVPTIAAVHGYCLAGAFEVALACDMTICSEDAVFGEPEVRFGSGAVAMLFPWIMGPKQAKEIVLSGEDRITAARAEAIGFVNRVVPRDDLETETLELARRIAKSSALSVRLSKRAINCSYDVMGLRDALRAGLEIDVEINATPTWEKQEFSRIRKAEGVKAAIAWRDARFRD